MNKVAYFTMDVESFYETSCIKEKDIKEDPKFNCSRGLKIYLDLLKKENIPATFFVSIPFLSFVKDDLEEAILSGSEIGLHALNHVPPKDVEDEIFQEEIKEAKKILEDEFKTEVKSYRAPCFGLDDKKREIIYSLGFLNDSSYLNDERSARCAKLSLDGFERINDGVYQREDLKEFILCKSKVFGSEFVISGGGYLRIAPWWLSKTKLKKYLKQSNYYMFYVHPFEVIEEDLPELKGISSKERFYLKKGRKTYLKKIKQIIDLLKEEGFEFKTLSNS